MNPSPALPLRRGGKSNEEFSPLYKSPFFPSPLFSRGGTQEGDFWITTPYEFGKE